MKALVRLAASAIVAAIVSGALMAGTAQAAPTTCPATFHVLHDDRIGALQLPAGPYWITVSDRDRLSCAHASDLFRQFLEDYDGNLPGRWRVNAASSSFTWGAAGGFRVDQAGSPHGGGGGQHPGRGVVCPGSFHVLHNDYIGRLHLPSGHYRMTLLSAGSISCARASTLFSMFLQDYDGNLPGRWYVIPQTATFKRGAGHVGFRVKQPGTNPNGGGGGGSHGARRCPGTFRVLHNDRIGPLSFPAGRYWLSLLRSPRQISCRRASRLMTLFLNHPAGDLPGRWSVDPGIGAFTLGQTRIGFRAKPVPGARR